MVTVKICRGRRKAWAKVVQTSWGEGAAPPHQSEPKIKSADSEGATESAISTNHRKLRTPLQHQSRAPSEGDTRTKGNWGGLFVLQSQSSHQICTHYEVRKPHGDQWTMRPADQEKDQGTGTKGSGEETKGPVDQWTRAPTTVD